MTPEPRDLTERRVGQQLAAARAEIAGKDAEIKRLLTNCRLDADYIDTMVKALRDAENALAEEDCDKQVLEFVSRTLAAADARGK